jgi:hypothetical protein
LVIVSQKRSDTSAMRRSPFQETIAHRNPTGASMPRNPQIIADSDPYITCLAHTIH